MPNYIIDGTVLSKDTADQYMNIQ